VNAGQKVAQLGQATGTNVIHGASESTITGNFLACNGVGKSYGDNTIKYNAGDFSLTGKE
jgi:hypothetical protein